MNIHDPKVTVPKVTTGALPASRKVYCHPEAAPELRVPVREIALDASSRRAGFARLRHHRALQRSGRARSTSRRALPARASTG